MFEQLFKKMGVNDEKVLLEAKNALSSFQVSDASSFMISTKTRMPIKGIHKRTGGAANIHQEKNYEPLVK